MKSVTQEGFIVRSRVPGDTTTPGGRERLLQASVKQEIRHDIRQGGKDKGGVGGYNFR